MDLKYSPATLSKIEDIFAESGHFLRYEKGNFKSGYCLLKEKKIIIVNKYFSLEGKINCLVEILREIDIDASRLSEKTLALYQNMPSKAE